jgi:hypothetical protein
MNRLPWQIDKIIEVANCLQATGSTAASTGERIAAAFVLNRLDYLPDISALWVVRTAVEGCGHGRYVVSSLRAMNQFI